MKLLVFGQSGQVATELGLRCPAGWRMERLGRAGADLADPAACAARIAATEADLVINAAAWTAVDRAEAEEAAAHVVNAAAPAAMAQAAAARGLPFLHISTDYVFDGSGTEPWREDDPTGPLGAYGRTKLAGEAAVRAANPAHVILRTSWVVSAHGANFVKTMLRVGPARGSLHGGADGRLTLGGLRAGPARGSLNVVADQWGGPTPAADIADALLTIAAAFGAGRGVPGTFHFAGAPDVTWAGFARAIFATADLDVAVQDITTGQYPTPARRPSNSRLNCTALQQAYGIARPDWRAGLAAILRDPGEQA